MMPPAEDDDPYVYPGTAVLKNKLDITDPIKLHQAELRFALKGERQMPALSPDERGLRNAHLLLFGRLYEWAGELRTCELAKEQSLFSGHSSFSSRSMPLSGISTTSGT